MKKWIISSQQELDSMKLFKKYQNHWYFFSVDASLIHTRKYMFGEIKSLRKEGFYCFIVFVQLM